MTSSARVAPTASKRPKKAVAKTASARKAPVRDAAARRKAGTSIPKATGKSPTSVAIATELAPAVAIALLDKAELAPGAAPAALDCLAAGAAPSAEDGKVRVQLMFENGTVLPVEMSQDAGAALAKGLVKELAGDVPAAPAKRRSGK
jgi:hypothetical protein